MSNEDAKLIVKRSSTKASSAGRKIVGQLLTPKEMALVVGADGNCNTNNGHRMSTNSNFNQQGGTFSQNGGGTYTMVCNVAEQ